MLSNEQSVRTFSVFICYRRKDGDWHADWIDQALNGLSFTDKNGAACRLSTHYDRTAPGVVNWKDHHFPSLQKARALVVVGTPGISKDLSQPNKPDWVYEELRWWVANRRHPPIVVDTTGEGPRWLPDLVTANWPELNRLDLDKDEAERAKAAGDERYLARWRERIVGTIRESEQATVFEDNVKLKRQKRTLTVALVSVVLALAVAAGSLVRAIQSERAAKQSDEASRETVAFMSDLFAHADPDRTYGERLTADQVLRAGDVTARLSSMPAHVKWRVLEAMGSAHTGLGDYERAIELLTQAVDLAKGLSLDAASAYQLELAMGEALLNADRFSEARPHLEEANWFAEELHGGNHADRSAVLIALGDLETWSPEGDYEKARAFYRKALEMDEALANGVDMARDHNKIGYLEYYAGDHLQADKALRDSVDAASRALGGESNLLVARYQQDYAAVRYENSDLDGALELYLGAYGYLREVYGPNSGEVAYVETNIARIYIERDRIDEARDLLLHAVETQEKKFGADFQALAFSLNNLGLINLIDGDLDEARLKFQRAARIAEANDLHIGAQSLTHEAEIQLINGNLDEASVALDKAAAIVDAHQLATWRRAVYQSAHAELQLRRCELTKAGELLAITAEAFKTRWPGLDNAFVRADTRRRYALEEALRNTEACRSS